MANEKSKPNAQDTANRLLHLSISFQLYTEDNISTLLSDQYMKNSDYQYSVAKIISELSDKVPEKFNNFFTTLTSLTDCTALNAFSIKAAIVNIATHNKVSQSLSLSLSLSLSPSHNFNIYV